MFNILSNHFGGGDIYFFCQVSWLDRTWKGILLLKITVILKAFPPKLRSEKPNFNQVQFLKSFEFLLVFVGSICQDKVEISTNTQTTKKHIHEKFRFFIIWRCSNDHVKKYSLAADDTVRKMTPVAKGLPNQSVKNQDVKVRTMYYFGNMKQFFKAAWGSNMPNSTHLFWVVKSIFHEKSWSSPRPPL